MIRLDANESIWLRECPPYEPRPALGSDVRADVAIIGGGYTGVSTAFHLAKRHPNASILLLEGRSLGNGASGRNGGMVLNHLSGVHLPEDPDAALHRYGLFSGTIDTMRAIIGEHRLDVELSSRGSFEIFTSNADADAAQPQVERWQKTGLPMTFQTANQLAQRVGFAGAAGAIFDPRAGSLNGVRYLRAMRAVLENLGVTVHEGTVVQQVREGSTIELVTQSATVRCASVVLATNAYTPQLGYFSDRVMALHSHVVGTEPLSSAQLEHAGWSSRISFSDDLSRLTYGNVTDGSRILLGGGSNAAYDYIMGNRPTLESIPERARDAMTARLRECLPGTSDFVVPHAWSGPLGVTATRVPLIGVRGQHRNVYYSLGYSGSGITAATLAGRILTDIYDGELSAWANFPGVGERGLWLAPEPFRYVGYKIYTGLTGRSPRRTYRA